MLYLYLILVGMARFLVEFVRINPRVFIGLTEAQLISIAMIITGGAAWYWSAARRSAVEAREPLRA
jgi:phosphatidylglycerol:prolipoprotein diacylglycerol transferase